MKTFQTLYKRTKTGAIQQWHVAVEPSLGGRPCIVKQAGQLGGKLTTHEELVEDGKQKRSPLEQAEFMAESDWKKKRDEGYKSLEDLGITYSETGDIHLNGVQCFRGTSLQDVLDRTLPKFNTDASGNVKPMLATDWNKIKKIDYPVHVQPKFDGVRCLMIVTKTNVVMLSRSGKEYNSLDHIKFAVANAFYGVDNSPEFILDGEIYSEDLTFQEIVSAVKAYKDLSLKLRFRAYDIVNDDIWVDRLDKLAKLVYNIGSDLIEFTTTGRAESAEDVKEYHDMMVKSGHEGAMIRTLNGKYGQGQRSRDLLKVKEFDEEEYIIIGGKIDKVEMPIDDTQYTADDKAQVDSFTFICKDSEGRTFDPKPKGSRHVRADYMSRLRYCIGKKLTVRFFGYTEDGLPRFPIGKTIRDYD